jgi:hypothetical protein
LSVKLGPWRGKVARKREKGGGKREGKRGREGGKIDDLRGEKKD